MRMQRIYPKLGRECQQRQHDNKRHNPAPVAMVRYRRSLYTCVTGHGANDDEYYWRQGRDVYALTINQSIGYCGLTMFTLGETVNKYKEDKANRYDADECGSVFLQVDHEIEDVLGKRGLDLAPATILARLIEYLS